MPSEANPLFHHAGDEAGGDEVDGFFSKKHSEDMVALLSDPHDVYNSIKAEDVVLIAAAGPMAATATSDSTESVDPPMLAKLVSKDWGSPQLPRRLPTKLLLCDMSPSNIDQENERQRVLADAHKSASSCQLIRWNKSEFLLTFGTKGDLLSFCSKKPTYINTIIPAIEAESTYPCTTNISLTQGKLESVREDYSKALLSPFGGNMFLSMQGGASALSPEGALPRHMIQLTLSTRAANTNTIRQTMENEFAKDKWHKLERDVHKLENTQLYRHESVGELAVGVKLSGTDLQSSVRFILNVSSQEKMADMCQFYSKLLQTSGVSTTSNEVQCHIYPLDRASEFVIRCDVEATVSPPTSVSKP